MPNREKNCMARQYSDQMQCQCGLAWDVNDPEPPECPRHKLARDTLTSVRSLLEPRPERTYLLTLKEMPLRWLPACGISEGLYQVDWTDYPEFGYVMVTRPADTAAQGRNYLFFSKAGGQLVEVEVRDGFAGRVANRRDAMGPVRGEWVSA